MENKEIENQKEATEFDKYFGEFEDDYVIKLYEVPKGQRRKEWIEDFFNTVPTHEHIVTNYGAGHFVVMGNDKDAKIKSKNVFISPRAAERAARNPKPTMQGAAPNQAIPGAAPAPQAQAQPQSNFNEMLVLKLIEALGGQRKPASPVEDFRDQMNQMSALFMDNMKTINRELMSQTKTLVHAKLEDKPEPEPSFIQGLVETVSPFLDSFLNAKGVEAKIMENKIKADPNFQQVMANGELLDQFYNSMADTVGDEKANEVMAKMGFQVTPEPGTAPGPVPPQQPVTEPANGQVHETVTN